MFSPPLRGGAGGGVCRRGGGVCRGGVSAAAKKFNCVTPNFIKRFFFAPFAVFARKNIFARNWLRQGESA
ncbi:MAG: hypothetical protein BWK80_01670 [Desulfobacteraceae bacterium IS3]|nr:MAG: hypothetical protein BWK80_01670 [Desulfobacteraceae bacterium IS3]